MKIIKNFIIYFSLGIMSQGFIYPSSETIAIDNNKVSSSSSLSFSVAPTPSTTNPLISSEPQTNSASTNTSTTNNTSTNNSSTIAVDSNKLSTSSNSLSLSAKPAPSTVNPLVATPEKTTDDTADNDTEKTSTDSDKDEEISTEKNPSTTASENTTITPAPSSTTTSTSTPSTISTLPAAPSSNNVPTTKTVPSNSSTNSSTTSSTTTSSTQPPASTTDSSSNTTKDTTKEIVPVPPRIKLKSFLISVHIQNNFTKDATLKQIELSLSGKEASTASASNALNIKLPGVKNMYDRGSITSFDITTKDTATKSFNGIKSITVDTDTISLNKGVGWSSAHPIYITQKDGKWVLDI